MNRRFAACLGLMALLLAPACHRDKSPTSSSEPSIIPRVSPDDPAALALGSNAFTFALFAQEAPNLTERNFALSPLGATSALATVYHAARGETATELARALHFGFPPEQGPAAWANLERTLTADPGDLRLALSRGAWARRGANLVPEFVAAAAPSGGISELDFADQAAAAAVINDFIAKRTDQAIPQLLAPQAIAQDTTLLVVSAVHLKGPWAVPFNPRRTAADIFATPDGPRPVSMMRQNLAARMATIPQGQLLELPLKGGKWVVNFILPDEGTALADFVSQRLRSETFDQWLGELKEVPFLRVGLPRFQCDTSANLIPALRQLGAQRPFLATADFSGLSPQKNLAITQVFQRCRVEVEEGGVAATAATAVTISPRSLDPEPELEFIARRPFVFVIRATEPNLILFVGNVCRPEPRADRLQPNTD